MRNSYQQYLSEEKTNYYTVPTNFSIFFRDGETEEEFMKEDFKGGLTWSEMS